MKRAFEYVRLIIILGIIFFTGCSNVMEPPRTPELPAGKGYFTLSIGRVSFGKTILPLTVQSDFALFELVFSTWVYVEGEEEEPGEEVLVVVTVERTNATLGNPIVLEVGTWDLEITAFLDSGKTKPAASASLENIEIMSGINVTGSIELKAIIETGVTGTFKWNIDYPEEVISASMTITPFGEETGIGEQILFFTGVTPDIGKIDSLTLDTGYYSVALVISNGPREIVREEYLHIYQNLESIFEYSFTQDHFTVRSVTSGADSGPGSLRHAIANAAANSTIYIENGLDTISLESRLEITKSLTIAGNGATLTRSGLWIEESDTSQLLFVSNATVSISRLHFKDGRATSYGAAIRNSGGTVTLESCILSGNSTSSGTAVGGAVYNDGTLYLKGCTFYENSSGLSGGAVYNNNARILTLIGNLFFGNSAPSWPVVRYSGIVSSGGFNVVDQALGAGTGQCGWAVVSGDKTISSRPASPETFRLLSDRGAENVISVLPSGYPAVDFYGQSLNNDAAAGAVQETAEGYYLELTINNSVLGTVNVLPAANADGLYSGSVSLEADPAAVNYKLAHWLVDGKKAEIANPLIPLTLTMNAHTSVQTVFAKIITVDNLSDGTGSENIPGTLRHAMTNAEDWDLIRLSGGNLPETNTVKLTGTLPAITKTITIEGNGVILSPDELWNASNTSQLLRISGGTVSISRLHFKDGRASSYGAAIRIDSGSLILESCIFSGNATSSGTANGGALYSSGTLDLRGCTFYGNSSGNSGGAVYNSGTLSLTGNLFYGNIAPNGPVLRYGGTVSSGGYNVVDRTIGIGTGQSGWNAMPGDKTISDLPVSPVSFRLLSGREAANTIDTIPWDYPSEDFYGNSINSVAAAGAVQQTASGYYLDLSYNNTALGTVSILSVANADGLYSGSIALDANPAMEYDLAYFLVDGRKTRLSDPLTLSLNGHTRVQAVFARIFFVSDFSDGAGSAIDPTLRYALTNARDWDLIRFSEETMGARIVELTAALPAITKRITIEGNGVTLTRSQSWTAESDISQLLYINHGAAVVNISGLHFRDGRATSYGAAIRMSSGSLTLESCIFSGNRTSSNTARGGAVYSSGILSVKGCTFIRNSTLYRGGSIFNDGGTLQLTGNLFWENSASGATGAAGPVVYRGSGTVTSGGYNAVDVSYGTGTTECGWSAGTGDKSAGYWPISPKSFRLLSGSGAANTMNTVPDAYPAEDFYGNSINSGAAAGAVQATANGNGYYLELTMNRTTIGSVSIFPSPDEDGLISGPFTLTANPAANYGLAYWLKGTVREGYDNTLALTLNDHAKVQAVFGLFVSDFNDPQGLVQGTLRYALAYSGDGDTIWLSGVTPGQTIIARTRALPQIMRSMTIEGNGVVITKDPSWTLVNSASQLLQVNSSTAVVRIIRIHFKNGEASDYGGAMDNRGILTLESCIFSGNKTTSPIAFGGAIYNAGTLAIRGCTFHANSSPYQGGAIYNSSGTLTLAGNILYGNTASAGPNVHREAGTTNSGGYNRYNGSAGWTTVTSDSTVSSLPFNATTFVPTTNLQNVLPSNGLANFPLTDFYGNTRTWPGAPGAVNF